MFNNTEIAAGFTRLTVQRLRSSDRETLRAIFLLYLKNKAAAFPDLTERLAAVADRGDDKTASKLAALLTAFEEKGFSLSELKGGRSGLQTDKKGELIFKIRFGLTLLGYDLPENFSGSFDSGNGNTSGVMLFPSMTVKKTSGW